MNRRAFLAGLLASTAAVPIAKVAAPALDWRYVVGAADVPYSVVGPVSFNGKTFWAVGRTLWWLENDEWKQSLEPKARS